MALTPFQLPNPRESTPYTEDIEAMRMLGNPSTNKYAQDILTNLQTRHQLEGEQYQNELAAQHDYANRVLGVQQQTENIGSLANLLKQDVPNGPTYAFAIPALRSLMSNMAPDTANALSTQGFQARNADIAKQIGDFAKQMADAGYEIDPQEIQRWTSIMTQATLPLSLQVEQERGASAERVAQINAGNKDIGTTVVPPQQPGTGPMNVPVKPGDFGPNGLDLRKRIPGLRIPTPTVPPGRTNLPPAKTDQPAAPQAPPPQSTTKGPDAQDVNPTISALIPPKYMTSDTLSYDRSRWDGQKQTAQFPPGAVENIERLIARNGGRTVQSPDIIWGMDASGKMHGYRGVQ